MGGRTAAAQITCRLGNGERVLKEVARAGFRKLLTISSLAIVLEQRTTDYGPRATAGRQGFLHDMRASRVDAEVDLQQMAEPHCTAARRSAARRRSTKPPPP